jgi:16S rRNA processing protein RimM
LPPLEDGQYYVSDLIGFEVKDESNMVIGFLKEVLSTGSNDVFVIKSITGEEILLPALKVNVKEISLQNREIRVKLPEWAE